MQKRDKKAQLAVFVIVAIILVAGIIGFFLLRGKMFGKGYIDPAIRPVYDFTIDCIEDTGYNALEKVGSQGGYFLVFNKPSVEGRIPYYIYNKQNYMPEINSIEREISGSINEELSFCILNFKDFRNRYEITHEIKEIKTRIDSNKVLLNIKYLITITRDEKTYQLENFNVELPIRLGVVYNTAEQIVNEQSEDLTSICLSCLYDIGVQNRVHIDMLDYGEDTTIFTIIDDNSTINEEAYEFSFAVQY